MNKNKLLEKLRSNIDSIDDKIADLLDARMECGIKAGRLKKSVKDKTREEEIIKRISSRNSNLLDIEFYRNIYKNILDRSCNLQEKKMPLIAFQGTHGAYSQMAAKIWDKKLFTLPCSSFKEVFEGVENELYDFGIFPIENNLGGVVGRVNNLLLNNSSLQIIGCVVFPIEHCLLYQKGRDYREIKKVYSHPQALAQCSNFIEKIGLLPENYYDTAGAAKMISQKKMSGEAAIASKLSASLYNLQIIKDNLENSDSNVTRFLILSKKMLKEDGKKCSILFSTKHKTGSLSKVLEIFSKNGINLTRLESVAMGSGDSKFFLDFEGSLKEQKTKEILDQVEKQSNYFRFMGCYNEKKVR